MYVICLCWNTDHFPSGDHHPHGDVNSYFGLIHCRISPPQGLYHTVLPYRTGGKLLFPLCRTYAEENSNDQFLYSSGFGKKVNRNFADQWSTERIGIRIYHMITFVWHLIKLGELVLYFDTDSIIYQHVEGEYYPQIFNSLGGGRTSWMQIHGRGS